MYATSYHSNPLLAKKVDASIRKKGAEQIIDVDGDTLMQGK
jgi:hypothetical protein